MNTMDPFAELVQSFETLMVALDAASDPVARGTALDAEIARASTGTDARFAVQWAAFLRARAPRIARGGAVSLLQYAIADATTSPVTRAADAWLARGKWDRPYLRRIGKPLDAVPPDAPDGPRADVNAPTAVRWVSFAKQGRRAFSLDRAGIVREWDTDIGGFGDEIDIRTTNVRFEGIRADGCRLVVHTSDGAVVEWNLETRTSMTQLVANPDDTLRVDSDAAFAFADVGEGEINVWDISRWNIAGILTYERSMRWLHAPAGRILLCTREGRVSVVDGRTSMIISEAQLPDGFVDAPRLQCDGRTLAALSSDGVLRWFDLETGETREARGHEGEVTGVAMANGSSLIATVGADAMLRVYDVETGALLDSWEGDAPLTAVTVTANDRIAIGDARGEVFMFS